MCFYQATYSKVGNESFYIVDSTVIVLANAGLDTLYIPGVIVDILVDHQLVVVCHKTVLIINTEDEVSLIYILSRQVLQDDADMVGVLGQGHGVFVATAVIVNRQ